MLLLGHTGITLAATKVLAVYMGIKRFPELVDYRLVLMGSMLPDIIDKPLGGIILKETLGNGRIFAHTLLFLLLLFGLGVFFWYRFKRPGVLVLAWGSFVHHILDGMWLFPKTYLWPVYGWSFPEGAPEDWFWLWIQELLTNPWIYVPEMIGGAVILCFVMGLICRRQVGEFIKTGNIK